MPAVSGAGAGGPTLLLGRYDEAAFLAKFAEAGVVDEIEKRGFRDLAFEFDTSQGPLVHARLHGSKDGRRHLLLDGCLAEVRLHPGDHGLAEVTGKEPVDLLVVYWLREQDPTALFDASHERLPLQEHPGLGVLRRAFRVAFGLAKDLDKQGIGAFPKFFHDAAIFFHSRLFLFLDPAEQGRFEALLRDLSALSLQDASLALAGGAVRDRDGREVAWRPGLQLMPLVPRLTALFHSPAYQATCREAFDREHYALDAARLAEARAVFARSVGGP
jgi:hypothetical protein